jgi:hypothetical protein
MIGSQVDHAVPCEVQTRHCQGRFVTVTNARGSRGGEKGQNEKRAASFMVALRALQCDFTLSGILKRDVASANSQRSGLTSNTSTAASC